MRAILCLFLGGCGGEYYFRYGLPCDTVLVLCSEHEPVHAGYCYDPYGDYLNIEDQEYGLEGCSVGNGKVKCSSTHPVCIQKR